MDSIVELDRAGLEQQARAQCMTTYLGGDRLLCRVLGKYIMYVDAGDQGLTPHLALDGCWEPWVTLALARLTKPGWRCVDVGANVGYFTLLLADAVGNTGHVLAIEPNPRMVDLLKLNVAVNGFAPTVRIEPCAVAQRPQSTIELQVDRHDPGLASICAEPDSRCEQLPVAVATIDLLTVDWPRVDLVKIDAEGAEPAIWRGMRQTLARHRQIAIVMEFTPARYADPLRFIDEILADGFALQQVANDGTIVPLLDADLAKMSSEAGWTMLYLVRD